MITSSRSNSPNLFRVEDLYAGKVKGFLCFYLCSEYDISLKSFLVILYLYHFNEISATSGISGFILGIKAGSLTAETLQERTFQLTTVSRFRVTILESTQELAEVGAGIQVVSSDKEDV